MNSVIVYDMEVLRNYISFTAINFEDYLKVRDPMGDQSISKDKRSPYPEDIKLFDDIPKTVFELSCIEGYEVNELGGLMAFTSQNDYLVGFNSLGYDNLILNFLSMNSRRYRDIKKLIEKTYELSKYIVETPREIIYKEERMIILRRYNGNYYSIDVQKVASLDKLFKSLKATLINLKWHNILDYEMPPVSDLDKHYYSSSYNNEGLSLINHWDRYMIKEYVPGMQHYNTNDVLGTCEIFYFLLEDIKLRFEINEEYGVNVLSASDSKIGDVFFRKFYTEAANIPIGEFVKGRTYRNAMSLDKCIHSSVRFRTLPFKNMLKDIKSKIVYSTTELKIDFKHENVTYNIRSGGLHSVDYPGIFKSTEEESIVDADVNYK